MKKIISLVMCAVLLVTCAFALTSCGSKDTKIGLQSGTTSEMYAKALNGIEVVSFDSFALAATDMKNGNVDYVFCDKTTAAAICGEIDGLKIVPVSLAQEFYGIAIDKNQAKLKEKIDAILAKNAVEIAAKAAAIQAGTFKGEGVVSAEKDASKADKQLVLATNDEFAPFEYVESKDGVKTYYGIDMEIAKIIANELDMELVIEDMKFETVVGAVGNNGVDIAMSGLTITAEREEVVNFSTPYFTEDIVLVCKADDKTFDACKTVVDIFAIICNPSEK
jgi:ABC-type amino acid transport substrate-binding protein